VNLRISTAMTAATLALALVPAAYAKNTDAPASVSVCNTASQNWQGGTLVVAPEDPQGALRFADELRPKKDNGKGLVNAAMHSRALAVCGPGDVVEPGDSGGGEIVVDNGPGYGV
jgi:hypothetical protein